MNLIQLLAATLLVIMLCAACNKDSGTEPAVAQSYLKVTFDGQTTVYTDVRLSEGKLGSIVSLDITAGASSSDYLTITVFGSQAGTYPYRDDLNKYAQVSQVEYKTRGTVFQNYKALVCPDESDYYSTEGNVLIEEYVAGKLIKGRFSGALLDGNSDDDCSKESKPFSGEFYLTIKK